MDFPQLTMTLPDGREESIMKRTTLVGLAWSWFQGLVVRERRCRTGARRPSGCAHRW